MDSSYARQRYVKSHKQSLRYRTARPSGHSNRASSSDGSSVGTIHILFSSAYIVDSQRVHKNFIPTAIDASPSYVLSNTWGHRKAGLSPPSLCPALAFSKTNGTISLNRPQIDDKLQKSTISP